MLLSIFIGVWFFALFGTQFVRIAVFRSLRADKVARGYLLDTNMLSIGDTLAFQLFKERRRIDRQFQPKVRLFLFFNLAAIVVPLVMVAAYLAALLPEW
jgi:hypothetical protein